MSFAGLAYTTASTQPEKVKFTDNQVTIACKEKR